MPSLAEKIGGQSTQLKDVSVPNWYSLNRLDDGEYCWQYGFGRCHRQPVFYSQQSYPTIGEAYDAMLVHVQSRRDAEKDPMAYFWFSGFCARLRLLETEDIDGDADHLRVKKSALMSAFVGLSYLAEYLGPDYYKAANTYVDLDHVRAEWGDPEE